MPDICCCVNQDCPLFQKCYRAQAIWDDYQAVTNFQYETIDKDGEVEVLCDYYWRVETIK